MDFAVGDLSEPERDRIQEHLALCRECAHIAGESAAAEPESAGQGTLLTPGELDTEWKRFQAAAGMNRRPRRAMALAAALLVGLLGLTAWVLVREMIWPRTDEQVVRLQPVDGDQVRSARPEDTISRDGRFLLILDLLESESYPADAEYRLEVRTREGREVWNLQGVRPRADGTFRLPIPRRALPAGEYRILLFDPQGERIAEYLLQINPESP